jgi:hypothetical protein
MTVRVVFVCVAVATRLLKNNRGKVRTPHQPPVFGRFCRVFISFWQARTPRTPFAPSHKMLRVTLLDTLDTDTFLGAAVARLRISNTTTEEAIALRHALQKDVCIAAVDSVTLHAYDGNLEAEIVAHRFGQLPIALLDTDDASTLWQSGGSAAAAAAATLEVSVTNDTDDLLWVTSHHIACSSGRVRICHYRSAEERDAAGNTGFLVCPLLAGQTLRATATVSVSTARARDARWSAVFVAMTPTNLHDDFVSDEPDDAIAPTEYEFYIETSGAVSALSAWRQAVAAVSRQIKALASPAVVRPLVHA